jgi:hypothetical protein
MKKTGKRPSRREVRVDLPRESMALLDGIVSEECWASRGALVDALIRTYERQRDVHPYSRKRRNALPLTVPVSLPVEARAIVRKRVALDPKNTFDAEVIVSALWRMRSRQMQPDEQHDELTRTLLRSLKSGRGRLANAKYFQDLRDHAREQVKRIRKAEARGELANFTLPRELFEFVTTEMLSGRHDTPTAVVCAALERCERERWKHETAWAEEVKEFEEHEAAYLRAHGQETADGRARDRRFGNVVRREEGRRSP